MVVSAGRLESGNGSLIASLVTIRHRFRAFVCTSSPRRRDGFEESICCVPTGLKGVEVRCVILHYGSQRSFHYRGNQVIALPPRPGSMPVGSTSDLNTVVDS
ncbi:hypothetical protein B296_00023183 [Ensete ventricosum]|uniref:Uncharacterized protein n=1 Tax=Ensete ventricosum TaxID=4639 RepID=A0A427AWT2_ENSVE|nr:hypothetical protein B296_00023183 [Ensete ventricosum]